MWGTWTILRQSITLVNLETRTTLITMISRRCGAPGSIFRCTIAARQCRTQLKTRSSLSPKLDSTENAISHQLYAIQTDCLGRFKGSWMVGNPSLTGLDYGRVARHPGRISCLTTSRNA